jgi:lipoprotein NlpI
MLRSLAASGSYPVENSPMIDEFARDDRAMQNQKVVEAAARQTIMRSVLKFVAALLFMLVFFLLWDRAEITYFRAISYNNSGRALDAKGDFDRALTDFNEAIRLDPQNASFYINRGNAYETKGDLDRAISDFDEAIRLRPKSATAYYQRANSYSTKGDFDRAIADYSQVIRIYPNLASGYANRGRAFFYGSSLSDARADFKQALRLDPKDAYTALWLDLVERRDNLPSELPQLAMHLDMTAWPAPVVKLFLGDLTVDAVLAAAADPKPETMRGQVCEANFYTAELKLLNHANNEALRLFQVAASDCPRSFDEWRAANEELRRLNASR